MQSHYKEIVYSLPLSPHEFLVFIWSTSQVWRPEPTLQSLDAFKPESPGLGTQSPSAVNILLMQSFLRVGHQKNFAILIKICSEWCPYCGIHLIYKCPQRLLFPVVKEGWCTCGILTDRKTYVKEVITCDSLVSIFHTFAKIMYTSVN